MAIRLHSASEENLKLLAHCLFLLFGQSYKHLQPIILLQGFDPVSEASVNSITQELDWRACGRLFPKVINVEVPDNGDYRSKLLNVALDQADGQYFAILDHGDIIYGGAYEYLIGRLNKSNLPIAFGNIKRVDLTPVNGFYYQNCKFEPFHGADRYDEFWENFLPIHSFVIERDRVDDSDLWFDEEMSKNEDYHFLVRILAKYDGDFGGRYKFSENIKFVQMAQTV